MYVIIHASYFASYCCLMFLMTDLLVVIDITNISGFYGTVVVVVGFLLMPAKIG